LAEVTVTDPSKSAAPVTRESIPVSSPRLLPRFTLSGLRVSTESSPAQHASLRNP
jgi:hypothetical protein